MGNVVQEKGASDRDFFVQGMGQGTLSFSKEKPRPEF
jgi:hypothetical protein